MRGPELRHQRVPSADQQGRTPSYSNHFHNHRPTSTGRTPSPVLHHPPQQPPQDHSIESTDGELGRGGQDLAEAPPPCGRLLRGLLWGQQYRHSNPQCEGGMPGSFELREDMGEDRLRAVEEWLRAEGYENRFRRKRLRTWPRPDRPGEGLRPDGIEEDEKPNEYPSGASIRSWGTSAGCRAAAAARLLGRRSVPPGTGGGTGSGGSTRNPWPPKPPKAPGAEPQPTTPNGPMVATTPATPPLVTSWKSPSKPRPSPVRCS